MRILLVHVGGPFPPVEPLGLEHIAFTLREAGWNVRIFDIAVNHPWKELLARKVSIFRPHLTGVSIRNADDCTWPHCQSYAPLARQVVQILKKTIDTPVVLGGCGYSIFPGALLRYTRADYGVVGDGEHLMLRASAFLAKGENPGLPGVFCRKGNRVFSLSQKEEMRGPPGGRIFHQSRLYYRLGGQGNAEASRGCPYGCIFCVDPVIKGTIHRKKPPEEVAEELESLTRRWIAHVHMCDSEFNIDPEHLHRVLDEILRRGIGNKLRWYAYMLPMMLDWDLVRLMKYSGCEGINFTVSSGSEKMLNAYNHPFSTDDVERTARLFQRTGIPFMFDMIVGGPGETVSTLKETIKFLKKISPTCVGFALGLRVYPGTPLALLVTERLKAGETQGLYGYVHNNPELLRPLFYISEHLKEEDIKNALAELHSLPYPVFAPSLKKASPHAYTASTRLRKALEKGYKGAHWLILARN